MVPRRRSPPRRLAAARERYIFRDGSGPARRPPPSDWSSVFGGPAWQPVGDGAVVPAPVRARAARPQLGRRRGPPGVPHHAPASGPTAASTASASTSRTRWSRTSPSPSPEADLAADGSRGGRTRSRTATRSTTSTPSGAGSSTSTTRRAPPSPRPGSPAHRRSRYASPDGPRAGVQLRPPRRRPGTRPPSGKLIYANLGTSPRSRARRPRRCSSPTTTSGCATPPVRAAPASPDVLPSSWLLPWLLTGGAAPPSSARELGLASRPRRDPCSPLALPGPPTSTRVRSSGLHEVAGPAAPTFSRTPPAALRARRLKGRDAAACRCRGARRVAVVRLRAATATYLPPPACSPSSPSSARRPTRSRLSPSTGPRSPSFPLSSSPTTLPAKPSPSAHVLHLSPPGRSHAVTHFRAEPLSPPPRVVTLSSHPLYTTHPPHHPYPHPRASCVVGRGAGPDGLAALVGPPSCRWPLDYPAPPPRTTVSQVTPCGQVGPACRLGHAGQRRRRMSRDSWSTAVCR